MSIQVNKHHLPNLIAMRLFNLFILSISFTSCIFDDTVSPESRLQVSNKVVLTAPKGDTLTNPGKSDTLRYNLSDFYSDNENLSLLVDSIFNSLSVNEKAAQLIMPATSEYYKIGIPFKNVKQALLKKQIGGVLYLKGTKKKFKIHIDELNLLTSKNKIAPLINSCDCEPTLYHKKFKDADSVTATNLLVTDELINAAVTKISGEIKSMGIQLNFAPVVDISINQEIIGTRSFSADPEEIFERANRFIAVSQAWNIAATIKHFPGHGAVKGDSHKQIVFIDGELTEVKTFERIIKASNPIAVMIGHIAIDNNPLYDENLPSTLSRKVITELLKNKIGFKGIVVTDAMQMKAVLNYQNASWKALVAGADLVIMPLNIQVLHNQIVTELGLKNSSLAKQFEVSIKKILRLKICTGVIK